MYNEAISELKKAEYQATVYNPSYFFPGYYQILGKAYCEKGDTGNGIKQIKIAISLNSSNADYHKSLAECYLKMGEEEQANKHFELAKSLEK